MWELSGKPPKEQKSKKKKPTRVAQAYMYVSACTQIKECNNNLKGESPGLLVGRKRKVVFKNLRPTPCVLMVSASRSLAPSSTLSPCPRKAGGSLCGALQCLWP